MFDAVHVWMLLMYGCCSCMDATHISILFMFDAQRAPDLYESDLLISSSSAGLSKFREIYPIV